MSDNENYPIVLKKTNIKDLIAETQLIREFSMYGCDEVPGKTIGYNPITKKCVDITGYFGPDAPIGVPAVPGVNKKGGGSITDIFTDPSRLAEFLYDVYIGAFDPEQIVDCAKNNPFASGLGFIIGSRPGGKSIVMMLPRIAFSTAKAVTPGIRKSISASQQIKAYKAAKSGAFSAISDGFLKALRKLRGKAGRVAAVVIGAGGMLVGTIKGALDYNEKKDVMSFVEWVEAEAWGNESYDNWKCLGAMAVLSVALGALGRAGTNGLAKLTGKALTAPVTVPIKIVKAITRSNAMKNMFTKALSISLKGSKTRNLEIFKELQKANGLPSGAKLFLDKADGAGKLKVSGLSGDIRIPKDKVPEKLKKYATDEGLVLKSDELQTELADLSTKVNKNINDQIQGSARAFGNSPYQKQLKLFNQILKKGGKLNKASIKSQAFENSMELLDKMHDEALTLAKKLGKIEKDLIKQKSAAESIVKELGTASKLPDLKKVETAVRKAKSADVDKVLSELYPGLSSQSPESFAKIQKYFKNYKDFDIAQKDLISQLELGKKALLDETGLMKGIFGDKNGSKALEDWTSTPAGQKWAGSFNSFPGKKAAAIKAVSSSAVKNALSKFLASEDLLIVGGAVAAGTISSLKQTKIDNSAELSEIVSTLQDKLQNINFEEYLNPSDQSIDAQKLILFLISEAKKSSSQYSEETSKALSAWEGYARTDKKYISEIQNYVNRNDEGYPTPDDIKIRVGEIIRGTLTPGQEQKPAEKEASPEKVVSTPTGLMSQVPEGDLKSQSPFSLNIGGTSQQAGFTNKYFSLGGKRFKFNDSLGGDATIDSVKKSGDKILAKLSVGTVFGRVPKNYTLREKDLQNLFNKASQLSKNGKTKVKLGSESGNIIRIKERNEVLTMNRKDIKELVAEFLNENTGQGYAQYPYNVGGHSESEPDEDYMVEWKALVDDVCGPRKKNIDGDPNSVEDAAIEVAKILIKDSDLFRDVLELSGANKSVGNEILRKFKEVKDNIQFDSELDV